MKHDVERATYFAMVAAVCAALGVEDPADVRRITLDVDSVEVLVYEHNEFGAKYVGRSGGAAVAVHTVKVK